ncbi:MAG: Tetratricopeptide repeat protein [Gemmataceae bacterium]|nr:Tetratricopeptide repeat protein [Gemmataceae bacterium]
MGRTRWGDPGILGVLKFLVVAGLVIAGLAGGLLLAVVLGISAQRKANRANAPADAPPAAVPEDPDPPTHPPPPEPTGEYVEPTPAERAGFAAFFDRFNAAIGPDGLPALKALIDKNRLFVVAEHGRMYEGMTVAAEPGFRRRTADALATQATTAFTAANTPAWTGVEVRRVRWSPDRQSAAVIAVHRVPNSLAPVRFRWWLAAGPDGWRVYDQEHVAWGLRWSAGLPAVGPPGRDPRWVEVEDARQRIFETTIEYTGADPDAAKFPSRLPDAALPPPLDAARERARALNAAGHGDVPAARRHCDRAVELEPDVPLLHFVRGRVCYAGGQYEQALGHARAFVDLSGPDAPAEFLTGAALVRLHRPAEATAAFLRAWDLSPGATSTIDRLWAVLPADRRDEIGKRLAPLGNRDQLMEHVATLASRDKDEAGFQAVVRGYRQVRPDDYRVVLAEINGHVRARRFADADKVFAGALAKRTPEDRDQLIDWYAGYMVRLGRPVEVYEAVPTGLAGLGFYAVSRGLDAAADDPDPARAAIAAEQFKALIAAHRKRAPDDPTLRLYEARQLYRGGHIAEADELLAEGLKLIEKTPPASGLDGVRWEAVRVSLRGFRVDCLYLLRKGLTAYRELGPDPPVFEKLAVLFDRDKDAAGLRALVEEHGKRAPGDKTLPFWRAMGQFLDGKYPAAAAAFAAEYPRPVTPAHARLAKDRWVRCLLRDGKVPEAVKLVAGSPPGEIGPDLAAAVAGADGDAIVVERVLADAKRTGTLPWMYADEDFAREIAREKYAGLRKKYPAPSGPGRKID